LVRIKKRGNGAWEAVAGFSGFPYFWGLTHIKGHKYAISYPYLAIQHVHQNFFNNPTLIGMDVGKEKFVNNISVCHLRNYDIKNKQQE
jgi:hypothetical protein